MPCLDENTIAAYIEGSLSADETAAVARHVDSCPTCRALLIGQVRCLPDPPVHPAGDAAQAYPTFQHYDVQGEYARGGQARILLAIDEIVGREVAVKELLANRSDQTVQTSSRFLREARISGQLQHPGVVPVYEIGRKDDGQLYYTMQLVRGETLAAALAACGNLTQRLGLLGHCLDLCNTIAYAHSRGVIHRDIKPQNVMVGRYGETIVLDWGLAAVRATTGEHRPLRRVEPGSADESDGLTTIDGTSLGTPAYMSPEQARGQVDQVDRRSDIFCLGAVLYEILTGQAPYTGSTLDEVLDKARRGVFTPVPGIAPGAPSELVAIAHKALDPDKDRRYRSADELAAEINAYMTGKRVAVYDYSPWELVRRFAARHKILLGASTLVFLVIVAALVIVSLAYSHEASALEQARIRQAQAQRESAVAAAARGHLLEARAKLRGSVEILDAAPARALWSRLGNNPLLWKKKLGSLLYELAFAPSGEWVAVASQARAVYLIRIDTQEMRILSTDDQIMTLDISPDGNLLATGNWTGDVRLWDIERGEMLRRLDGHGAKVWRVRFSPDGAYLASCSEDTTIRVWNVPSGELVREMTPVTANPNGPGQATAMDFGPTGHLMASLHGRAGAVVIWDWRRGTEVRKMQGHDRYGSCIDFSPSGRYVATGSTDWTVRIWNVQSGDTEFVLPHPDYLSAVTFSPDGSRLATATSAGIIRIWDTSSGELARSLTGHEGSVDGLAFSPDGRWLASSGQDQTLRVWHLRGAEQEPVLHGHTGDVRDAGFSPDGLTIASTGMDRRVLLWNAATGEQQRVLDGARAWTTSLDFHPAADRLAVGSWDQTVSIWNLNDGSRRVLGGDDFGPVSAVRYAPGGDLLAAASVNTMLRVWDVASEQERHRLRGHIDQVLAVDFSPDGKRLVSAGRDWSLRVWDTRSGKQLHVYKGSAALTGAAMSPDGSRVATVGEDGALVVWNPQNGDQRLIGRYPARAYFTAFSPDGVRIGVAYSDATARIWNLRDGSSLPLVGHRAEVNSIRFGPRGKRVVTSSDDATVRVWDAASGRPLWRAPLLLPAPPRLFCHRGWRRLDRTDQPADPPPAGAWVQAVESRALSVSLLPGNEAMCLQTYDGHVELWDLGRDRRVLRRRFPDLQNVLGVTGGCLALAGHKAVLLRAGGDQHTLAEEASGIGFDHGELLVAAGRQIRIHGPDGRLRRRLPAERGVSAVMRCAGRLVLGFADGSLYATTATPSTARPGFFFPSTPPSPVVRLLPGPMDTAIAGYTNGQVGIWDLEDGSLLDKTRLHGAAIHLLVDGTRLLAASELGDHQVVDLGVYQLDYCALLRWIWQEVPIVWEGGRSRLRPPPRGHRCAGR